jgi:hypothetical protein
VFEPVFGAEYLVRLAQEDPKTFGPLLVKNDASGSEGCDGGRPPGEMQLGGRHAYRGFLDMANLRLCSHSVHL